ncbi:DoxX family protein [Mycobacterium sp.]|jgi:uncharacterized membrane protein YphA (DoxX/SURF4 family)|uniref:DoxX family protein n=1 Tax=Mycobacterium sp. TaxID=1785 RepID=UPI002D41431E|nr:DoxX family protein [Mycobacterium sp.]HZA09073.1 DoxX family protein [Mycobacterium sp.]
MNLALWIIAIVLAVGFAASGLMKLFVPKDKLVTAGQGWAADFSPTNIRLIGAIEILGALGLILPAALNIAPILVPLAAVGLALVMLGAAVTHARRKEIPNIAVNVVLLVLAIVLAWGRFGPYSSTS